MSVFVAFDAGVIKFRLGFSIFAYGAHEIGLTFKMMDRATFLLARLLSLSFSLLLTLFSLSSLLLSYRFGPSWAFRDGLSVSSFSVILEKCPIFLFLLFYFISLLSFFKMAIVSESQFVTYFSLLWSWFTIRNLQWCSSYANSLFFVFFFYILFPFHWWYVEPIGNLITIQVLGV